MKTNSQIIRLNEAIKNLLKRYAKIIFFFLLALLIIIFFKKLFVIAIFLGINAIVALIWMYFHNRSIAIEFMSFTSILCFYAYGLKAGIIVMFISVLIHNFITTNMSVNNMISVFSAPIILLAMSPLKGIGIVHFGIIYAIINNIIFWLLVLFLHTSTVYKRLIFTITHLIWIFFIFKNFAEPILNILI